MYSTWQYTVVVIPPKKRQVIFKHEIEQYQIYNDDDMIPFL